jgi:ribosomal protein S18 acetylase RimI-like enzyme
MELVRNNRRYWDFIRKLRNMKNVKEGFIQQEYITEMQHAEHMIIYNNNYWVCLSDGETAGYVGVIDDDIRVATHPAFQERGVGTFMINEVMKIFPDASAKVKIDNKASLKLFEKCGFEKRFYLLEKV